MQSNAHALAWSMCILGTHARQAAVQVDCTILAGRMGWGFSCTCVCIQCSEQAVFHCLCCAVLVLCCVVLCALELCCTNASLTKQGVQWVWQGPAQVAL
jgi:hypothetical protein